ncbi:MAG TPA: hypothetical protein VGC06_10390 [Actinomycetes bacterium]
MVSLLESLPAGFKVSHDAAVAAAKLDQIPGAGADHDQIVVACDGFFDRLLAHTNLVEA